MLSVGVTNSTLYPLYYLCKFQSFLISIIYLTPRIPDKGLWIVDLESQLTAVDMKAQRGEVICSKAHNKVITELGGRPSIFGLQSLHSELSAVSS